VNLVRVSPSEADPVAVNPPASRYPFVTLPAKSLQAFAGTTPSALLTATLVPKKELFIVTVTVPVVMAITLLLLGGAVSLSLQGTSPPNVAVLEWTMISTGRATTISPL
jgi:hypothetical protein